MDSPASANSVSKVKGKFNLQAHDMYLEYADPSGVFSLIASQLQSRLPLRNLNWNSPGRPVRSIESLFIHFYPDEKTSVSQLPKRSASLAGHGGHDSQNRPSTPTSGEARRQSEGVGPKRERRHQIPGLRRTPYLKVYLLRCDDAEVYKNSARKLLREWIKANTPPSQSSATVSSQENHDAFEWMIVHVVLPDPQGNITWPSKVSANVVDKIRSDFNSSSRGAADRVSQIPATKNLQVQGVTVPGIPPGSAREPFLLESDRAWDDLIGKAKELILSSFDLRVRQYEEDIKEKGSQRSLPGWNFCTFFVLKEGLARGFESVGLIEDALVGYDELSAELLSTFREEEAKDARLFREHTQELLVQAEAALAGKRQPSTLTNYKRRKSSILDVNKKSYRELILSNNISAFDFRTYVFARQVALLLRSAAQIPPGGRTRSPHEQSKSPRDPSYLAEICQRAISFVADLARTIRQDLKASFKPESGANESALAARHTVTENLIASYVYSTAKLVLAKTQHSSLPEPTDLDLQDTEEDEYEEETSNPPSPNSNPPGPSISSTEKSPAPVSPRGSIVASNRSREDFSYAKASSELASGPPPASITLQLATRRGELFLIARRALSTVAAWQGWTTSWPEQDNEDFEEEQMDEISLTESIKRDTSGDSKNATTELSSPLAGILDESMSSALLSRDEFHHTYEMLSLAAFNLFQFAQDEKSAYAITADVASLRFRSKEYMGAANYFQDLAAFYARSDWVDLEVAILKMYGYCLKKLDKKEEYIRTGLRMLARSARSKSAWYNTKNVLDRAEDAGGGISNDIQSLVVESKCLKVPIVVNMEELFSKIHIQQYIQHGEEDDSFSLLLTFNSLLSDAFVAEAKVRMLSSSENPSRENWLSSKGAVRIGPGHCLVESMNPGWYNFDSIKLEAQKICFQHKYDKSGGYSEEKAQTEVPTRSNTPRALLWASNRALNVRASMYSTINLEQPRSIYIEMESSENAIESAKMILKSGSAGLRLHTADTELVVGHCRITDTTQASTVCFASLAPRAKIGVRIPYKLDTDIKEIFIRSETIYETVEGSFVRGESHRLSVQLPLGVNVQDIFKEYALFSKFAISTATGVPVQLLSCELKESEDFAAETPYMDGQRLLVFAKQPASLVYRITSKDKRTKHGKGRRKLSMHVDYKCLDEEVISRVQDCLSKELQGSLHWKYSGLLLPHLNHAARSIFTQQDLETAALLQEVNLPPYPELDWDSVLPSVPTGEREAISSWLVNWHASNQMIAICHDATSGFAAPKRQIVIPVEIPSLPVLHTASLCVAKRTPGNPFTVGDTISAELKIRHSRVWSQQADSSSDTLSFYYDLEAPSDIWLIAGQRRALFTATEGEVKTFPVLLLPLKAGKLMLPMLDITPARDDKKAGDAKPTGCELDYESQGAAVEVVPGTTSVTLDVEEGENGDLRGGIEILEMERRRHEEHLVEGQRSAKLMQAED